MIKPNLLFVGFIVVVLILIIGAYLILNNEKIEDQKLNNSNSNNNKINVVNLSEKEKEIISKISYNEVKHNVKPQFKVGDKFEYEIYSRGISIRGNFTVGGKYKVYVDKIDRIEGEDCYVVISTEEMPIPDRDNPSITTGAVVIERKDCIHKDTGKILKRFIQQGMLDNGEMKLLGMPTEATIPNETSEVEGNIAYYPWMLALDDNFKMEVKKNISDEEVSVFRVIGREKVNGRECFKVENRVLKNNRVQFRENIWVDIEKRILVKSETYHEDLKVLEINLVSKL